MSLRSYHVLIVDDEEGMREELRELLIDEGLVVELANDGIEGLEKLRNSHFDVAVVDLRMPRMTGLEMISHVDAEEIDTSVIILTGHGDKNDAVQALKLQETVKDWFEKSSLDAKTLTKRVKCLAEGLSFEEIDRLFAGITKAE
jgi:DNA-binding NtrC family response regulator